LWLVFWLGFGLSSQSGEYRSDLVVVVAAVSSWCAVVWQESVVYQLGE
jgi:hypothetical protein